MTSEPLLIPEAGGLGAESDSGSEAGTPTEGLHEFASALSAALTPGDVLDVVADVGCRLLGAESAYLSLLDEVGQVLQLVTSRHSPHWDRRTSASYPVDAPLPSRDALRTSRPVFIPNRDVRDTRYPALKEMAVDRGAWAVLPLVDDGDLLGVATWSWAAEQEFTTCQVGLCTQVTALCAPALQRALRYDLEYRARSAAEQVARRLRELQLLTTELALANDPAVVADLVCGAGVRALDADAATIGVFDGHRTITVIATSGLPPERAARWSTVDLDEYTLARDVLTTLEPVVLTSFADRDSRYPELTRAGSPFESWVTLPLITHGATLGLVSFGWKPSRSFGPDDLDFMGAIASHAAIALDRSQLLAATQQVAATMQRALLPKIVDHIDGWDLASCYRPAVEGTQVGGDWYDAFPIPGTGIGLVLGDVTGKGIHAATVMGSVRSATRAFAITDPRPRTVLARLDAYFSAFKPGEFVTCWYAVLDPATGHLTYASAGQLPPLVTGPAGARWCDQATTAPLGVGQGTTRVEADDTIARGEVVLLYSDGLIERRDRDLHHCMADLAQAAGPLLDATDLQAAVDALVHRLDHPSRTVDDIAVLALRREP
jgi:serine phosphatase RsbU (regulator of sigma subunit)